MHNWIREKIPDELISQKNNITTLTSQQVEHVTCLECCKYYIAPATATCGHTLCHGCWSGRRNCPVCKDTLDRRALRLNIPMQELTEHVHRIIDAFETLFKVKLDDLSLDITEGAKKASLSDPTKNVKDWLASSQNQFSAPVMSSQSHLSTQDLGQPLEVSKNKIQVHTHAQKSQSSPKVICAPQYEVDWDKIEVLPDSEDIITKNKENIVDVEPLFSDENEYTTENPRRSTRKRDYYNKYEFDPKPRVRSASADKYSSKNSSTETEKISTKVKQNWSNVKKMRKEFSKLSKINRSKLNVSIEMCKKAQNTKRALEPPTAFSQQAGYVIDDNTPDIMNHDKKDAESKNMTDGSSRTQNNGKHASNNHVLKLNESSNKKCKLSDDRKSTATLQSKKKSCDIVTSQHDNSKDKEDAQNFENNASLGAKDKPLQGDQSDINNSSKANSGQEKSKVYFEQETVKTNVVPFRKKGVLHKKTTEENNCVQIIHNEIESEAVPNTDNIEISIKVGNTITNIIIKKKQDVHLKVNADQEIQTSLGPYKLPTKQDASCSPFKEINVVNLQLTIDGNKVGKVTPECKTVSTKKNTDSADTATANFEITDSVEKEISDVMDCIETDNAINKQIRKTPQASVETDNTINKQIRKTPQASVETDNAINKQVRNTPQASKPPSVAKPLHTKEMMITDINEIEDLNDIDIFESDSVKEAVQLLKNTKFTPSEIIPTTIKNQKLKRIPDKRNRDVTDEADVPSNKKQKIDTNKSQTAVNDVPENENIMDIANDSESMTYDRIMGQVFENIDADIKSQSTVKNTQKPKQINDKSNNSNVQFPSSQIIQKTQRNNSILTQKLVPPSTSKTQEQIYQKYSENIFSMVDKDIESHSETRKNNSPRDEAASVVVIGDNTQADVGPEMEHIMGTPVVDDDSDRSVVEETPQKNVSFTKLKSKQDVSNKVIHNDEKQVDSNAENPPAELRRQQTDSQIIKSIINISDIPEDSPSIKDRTVLEIAKKVSVLETPLTINKFFNDVTHKSTPVARKSLNFDSENMEDLEQTLCPTTTQEKEFLNKAFEPTPRAPVGRILGLKNVSFKETKKFCIAGSCLNNNEVTNLKLLCQRHGWSYIDKYTEDLTHLVVSVDDDNKSKRSVKYMCALAASKWIVSYMWVEKCLKTKDVVDEAPYEALDACGDPGPKRSRTAQSKLFEGFKFYCMPPFSVLDVQTLKHIVVKAGGRVVQDPQGVRVATEGGAAPALLLAEPEHTQEDRFIYLAMEFSIVPVNFEWVLNCLGSYSLGSLHDHLLCPASLLPQATALWPDSLLMRDSDGSEEE